MKIILLLALYMSQGLPFGFQATALPVYLRSQGISLGTIGLAGALSLPWMLKAIWAPFVDRWGSETIGKRKSWIIPLQILLVITIFSASRINPSQNIQLLMLLTFIMNLLASVQDIAVDALAVDVLDTMELGPGNAAQVAGYKTGMILTGGLLLWLNSIIGWSGYFISTAALATIPLLLILFYTEKPCDNKLETPSIKKIILRSKPLFTTRNGIILVLFIASYKTGEALIDCMFKPFLIDNGFGITQIGLWIGSWGMLASIAGSIMGGFLTVRMEVIKTLHLALMLRLIPLAGEILLTVLNPNADMVVMVTIAEHFFGGILTTVLYAFMMSCVDHEIAATNYTILACIEVLGKSPGVWLSGLIAESRGYTFLFTTGFVLSLFPIIIAKYLSQLPVEHKNLNV